MYADVGSIRCHSMGVFYWRKRRYNCLSVSVLPGCQEAAGEEKQCQTNVKKHFGDLLSYKHSDGLTPSYTELVTTRAGQLMRADKVSLVYPGQTNVLLSGFFFQDFGMHLSERTVSE